MTVIIMFINVIMICLDVIYERIKHRCEKYECLFVDHIYTHIHDKKLYTLDKLNIYTHIIHRRTKTDMKNMSVYLTNMNPCTHVYDKKLYTLRKPVSYTHLTLPTILRV